MDGRKLYNENQIKFLNKQLGELCIKIDNSRLPEEFKMLCKLQKQYKKLISYYYSLIED